MSHTGRSNRWKKARCIYLENTPRVLLINRGGVYWEQLTRKYRCWRMRRTPTEIWFCDDACWVIIDLNGRSIPPLWSAWGMTSLVPMSHNRFHFSRFYGSDQFTEIFSAPAQDIKGFDFSVILVYCLINYVKFSAIYVLTTSPLVNRVIVWLIGRRVASVANSQPTR